MQLFFNESLQVQRSVSMLQNWRYTEAGLQRNLKTVGSYYRSRNFAVRNNHFLVKLLNSIGVDQSINIERYYNIVNAKTDKIAMHFKLTSPVYSGKLFSGVFYGPNVREIIIADDTYISPYFIEKNWRDVQAVRVIDHPRSDLHLSLLTGKELTEDTGSATIVINIAALALQYRQFLLDQVEQRQIEDKDTLQNTAIFIHKYVLPGMLSSHLDIALFNRIVNLMLNKPMADISIKSDHPFYLIDYSKFIDDIYRTLIVKFKYNEYDFWTILRSIPVLTAGDAQQLMRLPELTETRQLLWAEFVSRIKCLMFLFSCTPSLGRTASAKELSYLTKAIKLAKNDSIFSQTLSHDLNEQLQANIADLMSIATSANLI